jgi:hypothetical protein
MIITIVIIDMMIMQQNEGQQQEVETESCRTRDEQHLRRFAGIASVSSLELQFQ